MISPIAISSPRIVEGNLAYADQAYVAWCAARPDFEVRVTAISEYRARVAAGIVLSEPAWRVRVRPAIPSLELA